MTRLSQREAQVLALARLGRTTKEIASALGISPSTVNWHRKQGLARETAAVAAKRERRTRLAAG